jgi:hypothetical protein
MGMALVDFHERQLTIKLVYYGPPLSGKTTNLRWIHSRVDELNRGRLMTLDTRDDRTLFFDLLPIFFKSSGLSFRLKVYTVPGQPMHAATRRIVLQQADGVAFIADSRRAQAEANRASFANLLQNLDSVGLSQQKVPIIVQYNKRDLPDIFEEAELPALGSPHPVQLATALEGEGVLETFVALVERTWDAVERDTRIEKNFGIDQAAFMEAVRSHLTSKSPPTSA